MLILETPRLLLRTFQASDIPLLAAMNADPEVMRWLGGPMTPERTRGRALAVQARMSAGGTGMLPVERRGDGAFLGIVGLNRLDWYPEDIEVGWRLRPEAWGQGYATEAGRAWIAHAFDRPGADRVISVPDARNRRSIAVMERLGMRLDHHTRLKDEDDEFDVAVHAVTREEWSRRSSGAAA